jgi:leucyl-tRNA---protein transferase
MEFPHDEPQFCSYPAPKPPVAVPLVTTEPHPCPYLPDRQASLRAFRIQRLEGDLYHQFMDASFRRSGQFIYQPVCVGCRSCIPIRVNVRAFKPNKSQRRCWRQNQDLRIEITKPDCSDEKFELYQRYLAGWHGQRDAPLDKVGLQSFLYSSPVDTLEFSYRDEGGRLLAIGICDVCTLSLSSVYYFFDPAHAQRGLGNFGVLKELQFARDRGIGYYYLGYWVQNSPAMSYKANFRPHELLGPDNKWRLGDQ